MWARRRASREMQAAASDLRGGGGTSGEGGADHSPSPTDRHGRSRPVARRSSAILVAGAVAVAAIAGTTAQARSAATPASTSPPTISGEAVAPLRRGRRPAGRVELRNDRRRYDVELRAVEHRRRLAAARARHGVERGRIAGRRLEPDGRRWYANEMGAVPDHVPVVVVSVAASTVDPEITGRDEGVGSNGRPRDASRVRPPVDVVRIGPRASL